MSSELVSLRHEIWALLQRAARDKRHVARTPVLATAGEIGGASARMVVLRKVDRDEETLDIYTDRRSRKWRELERDPRATLVFWSPDQRMQLRAEGAVQLVSGGTDLEFTLEGLSPQAQTAYASRKPPGHGLQGPEHERDADPLENFGVIRLHVLEFDVLILGPGPHRRARFRGDAAEWVVP